jgi:ATP-binding cassette subfamily B protein
MTTILVSNRVSTARHADRIIVLTDGAITEIGSHDDLIRLDGWYAELERTQRRRGRLLRRNCTKQRRESDERAAA